MKRANYRTMNFEKMRKLRKDAGMTQKQLGEKVLVSESMINQIENGKKGVSRDLLKDIAEVLGVPARELL